MKWTDQQRDVIETRGQDVLVSAAAGSGKTAVLTARIIALIEEGHSIDEFLVITFTRAGAEDMKEKIRQQLAEKSRGEPYGFFAEELKKLPRAQISTIHAFCSAILRENFGALDIDPNFRVAGEGELRLMEEECLDEEMEARYKEGDPLFYELLEIFTRQRDDEGLRKVIVETENFLTQKPQRSRYLEKMADHYASFAFWEQLLERRKEQQFEAFMALYREILPLVKTRELLEFLEAEKERLREGQNINFERFPTKKFMQEELFKEEIKQARDHWKKIYESQRRLKKTEELQEQLEHSFAVIEKLVEIATRFGETFFKRRLQENKLSFYDLEHLALRAMEKPEIAEAYREKFSFVFIDEYQDTNELQEYLVSLFVREGGLFMVGDIKQSIYAFREARPELFIEKFHRYAQMEQKRRIDLTKNFRSAQPILKACNHVFERLMRKDFGGIDYDEAARLVFGNEALRDIEEDVEFLVTNTPGDPHEEELKSILARIKKLVEEGARYRDIVILYRSPKAFIEPAITLFREAGLPLFTDQGESFLESLEVKILLNYLEIINNALLDLPLLSLLRLPRYGFSDQELYQMRGRESFFHQGFYSYATPGELWDKKQFFMEEIRHLRWKSRQMGISELLHYLYRYVNFEEFVLPMTGGEQRLMNIRYLFERAREFEETTRVGLPAFLKFIGLLRDKKQDYESAKLLGEEADVIRLMSIHKSKGLQFPIVFVGGLWKKYNEMNYRGPLFFDDEVIVLDFFDLEKRRKEKSIFKEILIEKDKIRARQEEVRLLYVAMTRAERKLILSTYAKEPLGEGRALNFWELQSQQSFHDLLTKSLPSFAPPAPKYVMIETIEEDKKTKKGPWAVGGSPYIPPEAKKEAYKVGISSLITQDEPLVLHFSVEEGGKERGTRFHRAMELMDLQRAREDLRSELRRLEKEGVLKDFSDGALVEVFLNSSLGKRMLRSPRILREQPFILARDHRLLQGVVDLAFWEDGWVLVDYKTDRSLSYAPAYRTQMGYYKEAFEKITGEEVKEASLYFLRLNQTMTIKENTDES